MKLFVSELNPRADVIFLIIKLGLTELQQLMLLLIWQKMILICENVVYRTTM